MLVNQFKFASQIQPQHPRRGGGIYVGKGILDGVKYSGNLVPGTATVAVKDG